MSSLGYGTCAAFIRDRLNDMTESKSDKVFVCESGGLAVGVVTLHAIPLFRTTGQLVRITSLSVLEGWFRKGIGAKLVEAAEGWAWSEGAIRLEVTSGDHRDGAHKGLRRGAPVGCRHNEAVPRRDVREVSESRIECRVWLTSNDVCVQFTGGSCIRNLCSARFVLRHIRPIKFSVSSGYDDKI